MVSRNMIRRGVLLVLAVTLLGSGFACAYRRLRPGPNTEPRSIEWEGRTRTYLLHVPPGLPAEPVPLVLALHGGGGRGVQMETLTGFSALADREGFLVAYPDAWEHHWNDGREDAVSESHRLKVDDAGFLVAMIDAVGREFPVDTKRVYASGISNGAFMSHYLGATKASRIAAIAPVVGGLADPFHKVFSPSEPVAVMIVQGTEDPLVPYPGGDVEAIRKRGKLIPTEDAARLWSNANGCSGDAATRDLPDPVEDGCRSTEFRWSGKADVVLWKIEGGGHTWPGGPQYLPVGIVGRVTRDFDATTEIWTFFKAHPKP